jgi:type IX secretion system PorP/SprF family membrane protein
MKSIATFLFLSLAAAVSGQQEPLSTLFWTHYTFYNPAMSGLNYRHDAVVKYRNQWDGVNGAPNTLIAGYNAKSDKLHGGLGLNFTHDATGFVRQTGVMLNYSFQWKLGEEAVLAAGIGVGVQHFGIDENKLVFPAPPEIIMGTTQLNSNLGVVFHRKGLNTGVSVTQLNRTFKNGWISYDPVPHYICFADYLLRFGENVSLHPAMLVRTDLVEAGADFSVRGILKKKYWAGVCYRTSDAICFMAGWDIRERYRIGYAYDKTLNKLSGISHGSHEIVLGFLIR